MKDYKTENIINFSLVGHASSGKTTFAESLALCSGTITKAGTIESGSTLSDYRKQEPDSIVPALVIVPEHKAKDSANVVFPLEA
jgi:hypothetical protein